jgi:retron-type reverse transcriptase
MDIDWLKEAYRRTRKDGAVGVDGMTAAKYEQDSLDCSYGFRPRRSAHQALDSLRQQTMNYQGGWILEVDIRKFLDRAS